MPSDVDQLPIAWLLLLAPLIVGLAFRAPLYVLLIVDIALTTFLPGDWQVGGLKVDSTDMAYVAIAAALIAGRARLPKFRIPYLGLWIAFGVLVSLAYLQAPGNQEYLTDPVRAVYQVVRYCWKPILFYPLAVILITDRRKLQVTLLAIVVLADVCALQATWQGYQNLEASGPFTQKNALGGALVMPFILCLAGVLYPKSRQLKRFYMVSLILVARGLTISGSRGAFVAAVGGVVVLIGGVSTSPQGLSRVMRLAVGAIVGMLLLFAMKPDLLERPNVQNILSAASPDDVDTFQWRKEQRWPFFWNKIVNNPWFGVGTDVDNTLGQTCATPHNGYLSVAVKYGLPAGFALLTIALLAVRDAFVTFRRSRDATDRILGLTAAAAMIGLLFHNYADATIESAFIFQPFWLFTAVAALSARGRGAFAKIAAPAAVAPQQPAPSMQVSPEGASV